ncbi:MAG TPA: VWA domain-containing protein [Kofleriaceae bacterium]|nr:VWA domain-containing protein [Kofleriaceae bacterium]
MTFESPYLLLLLVPALVVAVLDARRRWPEGTRRNLAIAVRFALVSLLVLAASGPAIERDRRDTVVVFLIDRSASISDTALAQAWQQAGQLRDQADGARAAVVVFDHEAEVAIAPGEPWHAPAVLRTPGPAGAATDLGAAVRLAVGLVPPRAAAHLVYLGDGRINAGTLDAATAPAVARRIAISAFATAAPHDDPAVAAIVLDRDQIRPGATLSGKVEIDAGGVTGRGTLTVKVNGEVAATTPVVLEGKRVDVPLSYALPSTLAPGVIPVSAELALDGGTPDVEPGNDATTTPLVVQPQPKIVILDGDKEGATHLAKALRAEQMEVRVIPASNDGPAPDLEDADLVILANAPVRGGMNRGLLDEALGEQLVRWVDDGGGLLTLGGPSALNGYYAANRIADALPVEIEPVDPEVDQAATVIIILDQSGSMGEMVGGKMKLTLAAEGAAAVIRLMRSFDRVGVMAVEDRVNWVVKTRVIGSESAALESKTRRVELGGDGIFVYTSLVAAREELKKSPTSLRHVILFSDTFDAAEQVKGIDYGGFRGWPSSSPNSFQVARELKEMGASLSVIGVGWGQDRAFNKGSYFDDDDDSDFLKQLAAEGGGRYYRTADGRQLRALFVQDAQRLLDNDAREEDIQIEKKAAHPALDGVDLKKAPPLHGYQEVKPRPAAQVVAEDDEGHPILIRWPYGLGESVVWASDAGPRWAGDWVKWEGYSRFWTQLVRASLRRHEGNAVAMEVDFAGTMATVRVVDRPEEATRRGALTAHVTENGQTRPLALHVVEPGVHDAKLEVAADHDAVVEIKDRKGKVVARRTIVRAASVELRHRGPDEASLAAIAAATGGKVAPGSVAPSGGATTTTRSSLTLWLLLLALLALPLDAALRRRARAHVKD